MYDILEQRIQQKIGDVIGERAPNEEFHGKVVDVLAIGVAVGLARVDPALRKNVTNGPGESFIVLTGVGDDRIDTVIKQQVAFVKVMQSVCKVARAKTVLRG